MLPQEVIRRKRNGETLSAHEIQEFVKGVTAETVTEGQVAALAMAICFRGLTLPERIALTDAMATSGTVMEWKSLNLPGPILDKHSTGGVGDKVSLILAPVIAACGGFVPMISGRGLGHTGGTLDKMDSIPGYRSQPDGDLLRKAVREVGCAIIGATPDLAPADRRIYAIRDTTGTVESLDLITASILSKKLAAGLDGLVMDVKFGSGAFLPPMDQALSLAESIATVATGAGLPTVSLLTDMNQVLGPTAGNALEVRESINMLTGKHMDPRLLEVTVALCAELLLLGKLARTEAEARTRVMTALQSGAAAETFARMVAVLGGPKDLLDNPDSHLAKAAIQRPVLARTEGYLSVMNVRQMGVAVLALGGGRTRPADTIDFAVGLDEVAGLGARMGPHGQPLAVIHAQTEEAFRTAETLLQNAVTISDTPPAPTPAVAHRLVAE
ncbi:MAG: thymidine phosphorylase [Pseudomonadota bacterium]|nr:thymidine phosphorylase [Pseudomonadota bacterium]